MRPCMSGEMTLRAPKWQQRANWEVRGHRRSLEPRLWPMISPVAHLCLVATWNTCANLWTCSQETAEGKRLLFPWLVGFFLLFIFFLFPLHVVQSGGRLPVLMFFFVFFNRHAWLPRDFKDLTKPSAELASCSVGGRFQNCDGFMGKAEWVSQPSSAQRPLFIDVIRASLRGSCVCLPLVL